MNSLGAGGAAKPHLVNASNALTFCLMVVSCYFSSVIVHYIGIKGALIFGTYVPPHVHSRASHLPDWGSVMLRSQQGYTPTIDSELNGSLCLEQRFVESPLECFGWPKLQLQLHIPSHGTKVKLLATGSRTDWVARSWAAQSILVLMRIEMKPEKFHILSTSFSSLSRHVVLWLHCFWTGRQGTEAGWRKVNLTIAQNPWYEIKATSRLFFSKKFLLLVLFIGQAVFAEAVFFTYLACKLLAWSRQSTDILSVWFSVRARALGSFLSGIVAVTAGNLLGVFLLGLYMDIVLT
jgi:hypothetical protein